MVEVSITRLRHGRNPSYPTTPSQRSELLSWPFSVLGRPVVVLEKTAEPLVALDRPLPHRPRLDPHVPQSLVRPLSVVMPEVFWDCPT